MVEDLNKDKKIVFFEKNKKKYKNNQKNVIKKKI